MIKKCSLAFFLLLYSCCLHAQNFESVQLYYDLNTFKLNNTQKHTLDSVIENFSNRRIIINGHADYLGNEHSNQLVASQRANAVLRYLVDRGFPETQIMSSVGLGQANNDLNKSNTQNQDDAKSRKVIIYVTKGPYIKSKLKSVAVPNEPTAAVVPPPNITNINLNTLKVGDIIALKNISFVPGTDRVMAESNDELNNLFNVLKANPTLKIRLEGHVCCCIYPDGYVEDTPNWRLSYDRAYMVKSLLMVMGIAEERLSYRGFGRTKPIYTVEINQAQEQINRRVEIRIIEK